MKKLKRVCKATVVTLFILLILHLTVEIGFLATGCSYPASFDSFVDKSAGDFLTVADVNKISCAIEQVQKLIRTNDGTNAAPAHSFMADTDTGMYRSTTNTLDFTTGGTRAMSLAGSRIFGGNTTNITTGSNVGDVILANTNAFRFLNLAGTSSADYGVISTSANDLLLRVQASSDLIQFWAGAFKMVEWAAIGDGNGSGMRLTEASTACTGVANSGCLYARDNGSGKTQLCVIFGSGATQCFASEP